MRARSYGSADEGRGPPPPEERALVPAPGPAPASGCDNTPASAAAPAPGPAPRAGWLLPEDSEPVYVFWSAPPAWQQPASGPNPWPGRGPWPGPRPFPRQRAHRSSDSDAASWSTDAARQIQWREPSTLVERCPQKSTPSPPSRRPTPTPTPAPTPTLSPAPAPWRPSPPGDLRSLWAPKGPLKPAPSPTPHPAAKKPSSRGRASPPPKKKAGGSTSASVSSRTTASSGRPAPRKRVVRRKRKRKTGAATPSEHRAPKWRRPPAIPEACEAEAAAAAAGGGDSDSSGASRRRAPRASKVPRWLSLGLTELLETTKSVFSPSSHSSSSVDRRCEARRQDVEARVAKVLPERRSVAGNVIQEVDSSGDSVPPTPMVSQESFAAEAERSPSQERSQASIPSPIRSGSRIELHTVSFSVALRSPVQTIPQITRLPSSTDVCNQVQLEKINGQGLEVPSRARCSTEGNSPKTDCGVGGEEEYAKRLPSSEESYPSYSGSQKSEPASKNKISKTSTDFVDDKSRKPIAGQSVSLPKSFNIYLPNTAMSSQNIPENTPKTPTDSSNSALSESAVTQQKDLPPGLNSKSEIACKNTRSLFTVSPKEREISKTSVLRENVNLDGTVPSASCQNKTSENTIQDINASVGKSESTTTHRSVPSPSKSGKRVPRRRSRTPVPKSSSEVKSVSESIKVLVEKRTCVYSSSSSPSGTSTCEKVNISEDTAPQGRERDKDASALFPRRSTVSQRRSNVSSRSTSENRIGRKRSRTPVPKSSSHLKSVSDSVRNLLNMRTNACNISPSLSRESPSDETNVSGKGVQQKETDKRRLSREHPSFVRKNALSRLKIQKESVRSSVSAASLSTEGAKNLDIVNNPVEVNKGGDSCSSSASWGTQTEGTTITENIPQDDKKESEKSISPVSLITHAHISLASTSEHSAQTRSPDSLVETNANRFRNWGENRSSSDQRVSYVATKSKNKNEREGNRNEQFGMLKEKRNASEQIMCSVTPQSERRSSLPVSTAIESGWVKTDDFSIQENREGIQQNQNAVGDVRPHPQSTFFQRVVSTLQGTAPEPSLKSSDLSKKEHEFQAEDNWHTCKNTHSSNYPAKVRRKSEGSRSSQLQLDLQTEQDIEEMNQQKHSSPRKRLQQTEELHVPKLSKSLNRKVSKKSKQSEGSSFSENPFPEVNTSRSIKPRSKKNKIIPHKGRDAEWCLLDESNSPAQRKGVRWKRKKHRNRELSERGQNFSEYVICRMDSRSPFRSSSLPPTPTPGITWFLNEDESKLCNEVPCTEYSEQQSSKIFRNENGETGLPVLLSSPSPPIRFGAELDWITMGEVNCLEELVAEEGKRQEPRNSSRKFQTDTVSNNDVHQVHVSDTRVNSQRKSSSFETCPFNLRKSRNEVWKEEAEILRQKAQFISHRVNKYQRLSMETFGKENAVPLKERNYIRQMNRHKHLAQSFSDSTASLQNTDMENLIITEMALPGSTEIVSLDPTSSQSEQECRIYIEEIPNPQLRQEYQYYSEKCCSPISFRNSPEAHARYSSESPLDEETRLLANRGGVRQVTIVEHASASKRLLDRGTNTSAISVKTSYSREFQKAADRFFSRVLAHMALVKVGAGGAGGAGGAHGLLSGSDSRSSGVAVAEAAASGGTRLEVGRGRGRGRARLQAPADADAERSGGGGAAAGLSQITLSGPPPDAHSAAALAAAASVFSFVFSSAVDGGGRPPPSSDTSSGSRRSGAARARLWADNDERVCRICQDAQGELDNYCNCKGTMGLVHRECLQRWLCEARRAHCELCGFVYNLQLGPRYGSMRRSIGVWLCHHADRRQLVLDAVVLALFTPVAACLLWLAVHMAQRAEADAARPPRSAAGSPAQLQLPAVVLLAVAGVGACSAWLVMALRAHCVAWRDWYDRQITIRVLPKSVAPEGGRRTLVVRRSGLGLALGRGRGARSERAIVLDAYSSRDEVRRARGEGASTATGTGTGPPPPSFTLVRSARSTPSALDAASAPAGGAADAQQDAVDRRALSVARRSGSRLLAASSFVDDGAGPLPPPQRPLSTAAAAARTSPRPVLSWTAAGAPHPSAVAAASWLPHCANAALPSFSGWYCDHMGAGSSKAYAGGSMLSLSAFVEPSSSALDALWSSCTSTASSSASATSTSHSSSLTTSSCAAAAAAVAAANAHARSRACAVHRHAAYALASDSSGLGGGAGAGAGADYLPRSTSFPQGSLLSETQIEIQLTAQDMTQALDSSAPDVDESGKAEGKANAGAEVQNENGNSEKA